MSKRGPTARLTLLAMLLAAVAGPVAADWLVTLDGVQIETRGPWQVQGKLVVFRLADGTLSSIQLTELDLDASDRLTSSRSRPALKPQQRTRRASERPAFVITDDDVKHVNPDSLQAEGEEPKSVVSPPTAAHQESSGGEVAVAQWDTVYDEAIDGVVLSGTLENRDSRGHQELALQISLVDEGGVPAGNAHATLAKSALKGGETTTFRASFPGVPDFEKAEFGVTSSSLTSQMAAAETTTEPEAPVQVAAAAESELPAAEVSSAVEPDPSQVEAFVRAWAAAWSGQRVNDYLGFYAPDFAPAGGMSRADWVSQRRQRLTRPKWIKVTVGTVKQESLVKDRVSVTFPQTYEADHFSDEVVKTLVLVWLDDSWRIASEKAAG
ncbi:MAG: hypothetical protein EP299_00770 [Acidobacteria bacterium]|nr:MAG: hypothetical protein EP299_00770 [Acidobacteriota bacterium]